MKALSIAYELGVGFIVVDEAQNQQYSEGTFPEKRAKGGTIDANKKRKRDSTLIKLLITASNISHIPLLLTGTLELKPLLMSHFSRARRMSGRGSAEWRPLESSGSLEKLGEFEFFLKALFKLQWIRQPITLDSSWVSTFFHHTQGIPDIIVKLWEACQECAITTKAETITPDLVQKVFDAGFVTTAYGIRALRTKDELLLEAVTDLFDIDDLTQDQPPPNAEQKPKGAHIPSTAIGNKAKSKQSLRAALPSPTPALLTEDLLSEADLRSADPTHVAEMKGSDWEEEIKK